MSVLQMQEASYHRDQHYDPEDAKCRFVVEVEFTMTRKIALSARTEDEAAELAEHQIRREFPNAEWLMFDVARKEEI